MSSVPRVYTHNPEVDGQLATLFCAETDLVSFRTRRSRTKLIRQSHGPRWTEVEHRSMYQRVYRVGHAACLSVIGAYDVRYFGHERTEAACNLLFTVSEGAAILTVSDFCIQSAELPGAASQPVLMRSTTEELADRVAYGSERAPDGPLYTMLAGEYQADVDAARLRGWLDWVDDCERMRPRVLTVIDPGER